MLPDAGPMVAHPARRLSSVVPATHKEFDRWLRPSRLEA